MHRTIVVRPCCDNVTAVMIRPSAQVRLLLSPPYAAVAMQSPLLEVRSAERVLAVWPRGDAQWLAAAGRSSEVTLRSSVSLHVVQVAASPQWIVGASVLTAPSALLGEVLLLLWDWEGILRHVVRGVGLVARPSSDCLWLSSVLPTDDVGAVFVMSPLGGLSFVPLNSREVIQRVLPPLVDDSYRDHHCTTLLPRCITAATGTHHTEDGTSHTVIAVADSTGRVLLLRNLHSAVCELPPVEHNNNSTTAATDHHHPSVMETTALWIRIGTGTTMDIVQGSPSGGITIVKLEVTGGPSSRTGWSTSPSLQLKPVSRVVQRGIHHGPIQSIRFSAQDTQQEVQAYRSAGLAASCGGASDKQ